MPDAAKLLDAKSVSKNFGEFRAVAGADLTVAEGDIIGLIGPNGAGKSTFFNCLAGEMVPTAGRIVFNGEDLTRASPEAHARAGIGRTFQVPTTFEDMSVLHNVMVGAFLRHPHRNDARDKARRIVELTGLRPEQPARSLGTPGRKRLEIARALATEPRLLLLDESLAGLTPAELQEAIALVRRIHETGISIVIVEHIMEVIMTLTRHVVVFNQGHVIASGTPDSVVREPAVIEAYLGRGHRPRQDNTAKDNAPQKPCDRKSDVTELTVEHLEVRYGDLVGVADISLRVERGQVVALLGSNGAGKTTTLNAIAGLVRPSRGQIHWRGERISGQPAYAIVSKGLALSPEGWRLFVGQTVEQNLRLGATALSDRARTGALFERVYALFPRLAERRRQSAGTLSGGERQMLALGRALMSEPQLLMLDEPSLGLAPAVVEVLYETLKELHRQGLTLLLAEQSIPLALSLANYGYVLQTGRVALEGPAAQLERDANVQQIYLGIGA
jgi:ABC-type branched-subunit amino acid transport system ATPase component